ncbi:MAG TPA: hypothetical protein PLP57_10320 [Candidatus Saccharicenans sp.]|nr:hypothetical protein [Candidatus Saccharicenans sp.]HRD03016.1 hypothetical protein [Candidatus Saccharicenans sp.]
MKTNAPKSCTWWVSIIIGLLGVLGKIFFIPVLTTCSWWLVLVAFIILAVASVVKGL